MISRKKSRGLSPTDDDDDDVDDLKEMGINTTNCIDLTQDRNYWRALVNAALNLRVP